MRKPKTLQAFTPDEKLMAHHLLAVRVAYKMGSKFEEGDWASVYCRAKSIPVSGWSNTGIDVAYGLLGVEHKMLCLRSKPDLRYACGTTQMHPALTRSIRPPTTGSADAAMASALREYADIVHERTEKVRKESGQIGTPDMRVGWLMWQESLRHFMYFEEEMLPPDPRDYRAEWVESGGGGVRKKSRNLWVYEKVSGTKRYSITTDAGAKIQPYFDVPPPDDPNLYSFIVIGEVIRSGYVRVWVTERTRRELVRLIGNLQPDALTRVVLDAVRDMHGCAVVAGENSEAGSELEVAEEAYLALVSAFKGVNDDHRFQMLARYLDQHR